MQVGLDPLIMLSEGDPAPTFELPNQDGEPVGLEDYRGKPVIVYFYPRADTAGCTTEACGIRDEWAAFRERDVAVLGISDDPIEDLAAFAEKYDLPFELLSDEDGNVAAAYESYGEKNVFGNIVEGVFRNSYVIGPDGTIEATFGNVSPDGHAAELLEAVYEATNES